MERSIHNQTQLQHSEFLIVMISWLHMKTTKTRGMIRDGALYSQPNTVTTFRIPNGHDLLTSYED